MVETADFWSRSYQKNGNIVTRKISDEMVLVPISGNIADMARLFMLNPVGEYIWEHIDKKTTMAQIIEGVLDSFEIKRTQAEKDLKDFIQKLNNLELVS